MTGIELFSHHAPGIAEALRRTDDPGTIEDVAEAILEERAQVWGNEQALIITELYPNDATVHFWITTGELDAAIELSRLVMQWAKGLGYTRATLTGRKGWVKALAPEGWRQSAVLMSREL